MKKKGFTLIELLAVIIILAVIALIATPIVLNIVENAKREADKASANGILDAAKLYYAEMYLENKGSVSNYECTFSEGTGCSELTLTGTLPKSGTITINSSGIVNGRLEFEKNTFYICNSKVLETEDETCSIVNYENIYAITNEGVITGFKTKEETSYFELIPVVSAAELTDEASSYLSTKEITIPEYVGSIEVNGIASNAFSSYDITKVTILSNKVITIESNALPSTLTKLKVKSCYVSGYSAYSDILEEIPTECGVQKPEVSYKCKRADLNTLHTETCNQTSTTQYCSGAGYATGSTIRYGNENPTSGILASGDAFDCDVNGDGIYDPVTERFYYVSDLYDTTNKKFNSEYAVLIYYNNTSIDNNGNVVPDNTSSSLITYNSAGVNNKGPVTAITNLPTTKQWNNVSLYDIDRDILTYTDSVAFSGFNYSKIVDGVTVPLAARLLTTQEINVACGITVGSVTIGELDDCNYLMENMQYSSSSIGYYRWWLENPAPSNHAWGVGGHNRDIDYTVPDRNVNSGVRPAIEVLKSDIEIYTQPQVVLEDTKVDIKLSESYQLEPQVFGTDSNVNFFYESSDNSIATVSSTGLVTPLKEGVVTITVKTSNGLSATCDVNVLNKIIIFDSGMEPETVQNKFIYAGQQNGKVEYTEDYIRLYSSASGYYGRTIIYNEKIDFSKYSKIYVEAEASTSHQSSSYKTLSVKIVDDNNANVKTTVIPTGFDRQIIELDLSDYTAGENRVAIAMGSVSEVYVYKIWVE